MHVCICLCVHVCVLCLFTLHRCVAAPASAAGCPPAASGSGSGGCLLAAGCGAAAASAPPLAGAPPPGELSLVWTGTNKSSLWMWACRTADPLIFCFQVCSQKTPGGSLTVQTQLFPVKCGESCCLCKTLLTKNKISSSIWNLKSKLGEVDKNRPGSLWSNVRHLSKCVVFPLL